MDKENNQLIINDDDLHQMVRNTTKYNIIPWPAPHQLTYEIGRIVVGLHLQPNVVEETQHFGYIAKVRRLALAQQQQPIEHVEHLRRRLMHCDDHGFVLVQRQPLQHADQGGGGMRVETGRWLLCTRK